MLQLASISRWAYFSGYLAIILVQHFVAYRSTCEHLKLLVEEVEQVIVFDLLRHLLQQGLHDKYGLLLPLIVTDHLRVGSWWW